MDNKNMTLEEHAQVAKAQVVKAKLEKGLPLNEEETEIANGLDTIKKIRAIAEKTPQLPSKTVQEKREELLQRLSELKGKYKARAEAIAALPDGENDISDIEIKSLSMEKCQNLAESVGELLLDLETLKDIEEVNVVPVIISQISEFLTFLVPVASSADYDRAKKLTLDQVKILVGKFLRANKSFLSMLEFLNIDQEAILKMFSLETEGDAPTASASSSQEENKNPVR